MQKFLKNYTSNVPVSETLNSIEKVLLRCGVSGITKEYGPSARVLAVIFEIKVADLNMRVRLPANEEAALTALWMDYVGEDRLDSTGLKLEWGYGIRKKKSKKDFREQAERTAWKIVQDWVEVQMSMIQMKQAEFQQVFMPYIWDGEQTMYDRVKAGGYRALLPEKSNAA